MSLSRVFDRILITLATITTAGYLVAGSLFVMPQVSESSDRWLKQKHITDQRTRFTEISESELSAEEKIQSFVELLKDLQAVQKVDQLSNIKRSAFSQASHLSIQNNQLDLAEELATDWLAFDPNDISARLNRCRLLIKNQRQTSGETCYTSLMQQFPHSLAVAHGISRMHFYNGRIGAAYLALEPFLEKGGHPLKRIIGEEYRFHRIEDHQTPARLAFEDGLALGFSFESSTSQHVLEMIGIHNKNGVYRKELEYAGEIRIDSMEKGHFLEVTAHIVEPELLNAILHPEARPYLLADLKAMGAQDSVDRLNQHAGASL